MGLVRAWTRQVARAAGASLIAPLVLLLAAGVVASAGGLGGIGSLGQIASGPPLPDTGLETASSSSFEKAEIVGAEVRPRALERANPAAPPREALASASVPGTSAPVAGPGAPVTTVPGSTTTPLNGDGQDTNPSLRDEGGGRGTPPGGRRPPRNLGEGLRETTQGLSNALPEPLRPVTNNLLDLLLGPPPR